MEITKGENANLAGMEPLCPKIEVVEVCPANAPDKHSVRVNGREIVAFDYGHEAHSVAGNLRMALAQFFRSPAPTPPLDVEAEKRITEIRERESKATTGPWKAVIDGSSAWIESEKETVLPFFPPAKGSNVDFVVNSRLDIPFLLEQISLLRRHIASPAQPEHELLERITQRNLAREARENWKGRAKAALAPTPEVAPESVKLVSNREPTEAEIKQGLELQPMAEECLKRNRTPDVAPVKILRGQRKVSLELEHESETGTHSIGGVAPKE